MKQLTQRRPADGQTIPNTTGKPMLMVNVPLFVNLGHAIAIEAHAQGSLVVFAGGVGYIVRETPAEILHLPEIAFQE